MAEADLTMAYKLMGRSTAKEWLSVEQLPDRLAD